ncbi:MAG: alanine racemase [Thaumarchaeota archaeon]|nr:alanine racemase [Nitrososphaerota archaeon]
MGIGMAKEEIDTPALLIDLDLMEKNIETMASYYRSIKGAALRPHQKGHRLPVIAKKQINAGAVGVSMTSFGLAEFYAESGIDDILITSEVQGRNKIARLCGLSRHANVTVSVDDLANAKEISEMALSMGTRVNVAAEVYLSVLSAGVEPRMMKDFVREISKMKGLNFRGLWWHELFGIEGPAELRKKNHYAVLDTIADLKAEIEDSGIDVELLSGGHSYTWRITPQYERIQNVEVQVGSYVFNDWCSHQVEGLDVFDCALTVLTRCISRPKPDEAMFDIGTNSCANESGEDYGKVVGPRFKDVEGMDQVRLREEHGFANCKDSSVEIKTGQAYEVIPPHADTTAKMHDRYYGIRDGRVEVIWPNYGRGLF